MEELDESKKYLIFSIPRSGGTLLQVLLGEYLSVPIIREPYRSDIRIEKSKGGLIATKILLDSDLKELGRASEEIPLQSWRRKRNLLERQNPNYIFKLHAQHLYEVKEFPHPEDKRYLDLFDYLNDTYHFIILQRRNLLDRIISRRILDARYSPLDQYVGLEILEPESLHISKDKIKEQILWSQRLKDFSGLVRNKSFIYYEDYSDSEHPLKEVVRLLNFKGRKRVTKPYEEKHSRVPYPIPKEDYISNLDEVKEWIDELQER